MNSAEKGFSKEKCLVFFKPLTKQIKSNIRRIENQEKDKINGKGVNKSAEYVQKGIAKQVFSV